MMLKFAVLFSVVLLILLPAAMADVCVGACGTLGADGVVTLPPNGDSAYTYITTAGGVSGVGQIGTAPGTDGTTFTSSAFSANVGDKLDYFFNYVTSDGSGFPDYAWAQLLGPGTPITLLTATTEPSGTIIPSTAAGMPAIDPGVTLVPPSVPIISGGPAWSPLGVYSGACYAAGCGYTGWVESKYTFATAGTYRLEFGVTNVNDTLWDSGLAIAGAKINGSPIIGTPEPGALLLFGTVAGALALLRRRRVS